MAHPKLNTESINNLKLETYIIDLICRQMSFAAALQSLCLPPLLDEVLLDVLM